MGVQNYQNDCDVSNTDGANMWLFGAESEVNPCCEDQIERQLKQMGAYDPS